ncbi:hypothetical protein ACQCT6_12870 [Cytobacillus gottheilii]|uniref:hypothetical protein n=1 Tax=Cytobacillus gottheilii TaxID=859144 RepID=UPI003CEEAF32
MELSPLFIMLFLVNGLMGFFFYFVMYKKRKLFADRFGMVMAAAGSSIFCMNLAMLLHFIFPFEIGVLAILSTVIGGGIGLLYGALVRFQSLLAGFSHGSIGSIMGTMVGAVVENPALCGLPAAYFNDVENNMILFGLFGTGLVFATFGLLFYSLRV